MHIVSCPMVRLIPGTNDSTYGGAEIGDEPRLALMDRDVPNAITNRITTKLK